MKCIFFPVSHAKYSENVWILHVNKPKKTLEGGEKTGRFPRTQGTTQSAVSPLGIRTSTLGKKKAVHTNCSSPATGRLSPVAHGHQWGAQALASTEQSTHTPCRGDVRDQLWRWGFAPLSAAVTVDTPWKPCGNLAFHSPSPQW